MGWLRDVYGKNPAIKLLIDPSTGEILDANDAAAAFYGYSIEELCSRRVTEINTLHPAEVAAEMETARAGNRSFFRFKHRLASGDVRHVEVYTGPVDVRGKTCLLSIIHDVTDRERALEDLTASITERARLEADLHRAQRMEAMGRLAGGVAHDFNNLLSVILGAADDLARHPGSLLHFDRNLDRIREAAMRAADLTKQLLLVSRGNDARGEWINLRTVVEEAFRLYEGTFSDTVELVNDVPDDVAVFFPRTNIDQVLMNLVLNARDAMPCGGSLIIAARHLELDSGGGAALGAGRYVEITVEDTGIGMPAEVVAKAFDPFYTTKEPGKGTGLGLSTVYGIVRRAAGAVEIESEVGRGTTVRMLLPQGTENRAPAPTPAPITSRPAPPRMDKTILLVDDHRAVRDLIAQTLIDAGYVVLVAGDGVEALQVAAAASFTFDLLLTDVVMPKMRGPELALKVREARPSMPVLFVSGYTGDAVLEAGLDPHDLLEKPFGSDALLERVERALAATGSAAETEAGRKDRR